MCVGGWLCVCIGGVIMCVYVLAGVILLQTEAGCWPPAMSESRMKSHLP